VQPQRATAVRDRDSLDGAPSFFQKYCIQDGQVIQAGKIRHVPAEKSSIEGSPGGGEQGATNRVVGNLGPSEGLFKHLLRELFARLSADLRIEDSLGFGQIVV